MPREVKLKEQKGCGAPPKFVMRRGVPQPLLQLELEDLMKDLNRWIQEHWTSWVNLGWFCLAPCIYRFVRNDLLLRDPLQEFLRKRSARISESFNCTFAITRKVRTYGFGETSRTVVKITLVVVVHEIDFDSFAAEPLATRAEPWSEPNKEAPERLLMREEPVKEQVDLSEPKQEEGQRGGKSRSSTRSSRSVPFDEVYTSEEIDESSN